MKQIQHHDKKINKLDKKSATMNTMIKKIKFDKIQHHDKKIKTT